MIQTNAKNLRHNDHHAPRHAGTRGQSILEAELSCVVESTAGKHEAKDIPGRLFLQDTIPGHRANATVGKCCCYDGKRFDVLFDGAAVKVELKRSLEVYLIVKRPGCTVADGKKAKSA